MVSLLPIQVMFVMCS